jgi:hypothetical protein
VWDVGSDTRRDNVVLYYRYVSLIEKLTEKLKSRACGRGNERLWYESEFEMVVTVRR